MNRPRPRPPATERGSLIGRYMVNSTMHPELGAWVGAKASAEGISMSAWVRRLIAEEYERQEGRVWRPAG